MLAPGVWSGACSEDPEAVLASLFCPGARGGDAHMQDRRKGKGPFLAGPQAPGRASSRQPPAALSRGGTSWILSPGHFSAGCRKRRGGGPTTSLNFDPH